jgi:hypothetical protein
MAMTKEQFQEWEAIPLTKQFQQFLKDYRAYLMDRWAKGLTQDSQAQEMAKCQLLEQLANLDDDAIYEFYKENQKEGAPDVQAN